MYNLRISLDIRYVDQRTSSSYHIWAVYQRVEL